MSHGAVLICISLVTFESEHFRKGPREHISRRFHSEASSRDSEGGVRVGVWLAKGSSQLLGLRLHPQAGWRPVRQFICHFTRILGFL